MPAISFKATIEKLETTNTTARDFFKWFLDAFKNETKALDSYATRDILDSIWQTRVSSFETKNRIQPSQQQDQHNNQEDANTRAHNLQSFLELRDELLSRCTLMRNARVPNWPLSTPADHERKSNADALV